MLSISFPKEATQKRCSDYLGHELKSLVRLKKTQTTNKTTPSKLPDKLSCIFGGEDREQLAQVMQKLDMGSIPYSCWSSSVQHSLCKTWISDC